MFSSEVIKVVQVDQDRHYIIDPGWSLVHTCTVQVSEINWVTQPKMHPSYCGETETVQVAVPVSRVALVLKLTDNDMFNKYETDLDRSQSECVRLKVDVKDLQNKLIEKDKQLEELRDELNHVYCGKEDAQRGEKDALLMLEEYKTQYKQAEESRQRMEKDVARIRETLGSREMDRILGV